MRIIDGLVNNRLTKVYNDLQYLTITINENVHRHDRWKGDCFQRIIGSIQARLLKLEATLEGPLEEFICLSMLACLSTSFQVPGRRIRYWYLENRFRTSCHVINLDTSGCDLESLELWGLMMGAISVFEIERETWLVERLRILVEKMNMDWYKVRRMLRTCMWIECIHDGPGKKIFERIAIV
jgi:hypothetical protein